MRRKAKQALCPYCQTAISPGEPTTSCASCGLPYHVECWRENGGCATYGCPNHSPSRARSTSLTPMGPIDIEIGPATGAPPASYPTPEFTPTDTSQQPRPLLIVICEACAVFGAIVGLIAGFFFGLRAGLGSALLGALGGLVLGVVGGAIAVPLGIVTGSLYLAALSMEVIGLFGLALSLLFCISFFAMLYKIKVYSWPPIFS